MIKDEALNLALEALERYQVKRQDFDRFADVITAIKEALAQPEQEPVAYGKTELNCFAQDLYDQKMQEGKHGHYETMFHVVHQAIKRTTPPQRKPLTDEEIDRMYVSCKYGSVRELARAIEAAHGIKEKNT